MSQTMLADRPLRCKHCTATTRSSHDFARLAGWRMFKGVSVTGKPLDDVVCPACAGTAEPPEQPSWRVGCGTCDWEYEDEYDEGPLTEAQARQMARDHTCEPNPWVKAPEEAVGT